MCWIVWFTFKDTKLLEHLSSSLQSRAVDSQSSYVDQDISIFHAHLKISDLDKDTKQPFINDEIILAFVGEIYNTDFFIKRLKLSQDATESEIISMAYKKYGPDFVQYLNGEFCICIFDRKNKKLCLFRDRYGVKNLYYTVKNKELYFSSEIKSLVDPHTIISKIWEEMYRIFLYTLDPYTLFENIFTLEPWWYLTFEKWKIVKAPFAPFVFQEDKSTFISSLEKAVTRRIPKYQSKILLSLSGGIDSTIILYFLKKLYPGKIVTYSLLSDKNTQEIEIAVQNARKFEVEHCIIDMRKYSFEAYFKKNVLRHEGLVYCPDFIALLKENFPHVNDIKVEFAWDGKEELFLVNTHFAYERIEKEFKESHLKNIFWENFTPTQKFLNLSLFSYNLQLGEKITLGNWVERRLPFTDYELMKYSGDAHYKSEMVKILQKENIFVSQEKYGYNAWLNFQVFQWKDLTKHLAKYLQIFQNYNA